MSGRLVTVLPSPRPQLVSVGTAHPRWRYSQDEVATLLGVEEGVGRRLFRSSGIEARHLYLQPTSEGGLPNETQAQLLDRHRRGALELGAQALERCLGPHDLSNADVDFLCCVSSTGFMLPSLTAMYIRHLGFRDDCQRIDLVGMGCNAALNGLNATASWASVNPGRRAVMVCCEINSAIYVQDQRAVTALTNCLFGDGCAAVLVSAGDPGLEGPEVLGLSSCILPDVWRAISYHWSPMHNKFELFLDKEIPNVLGAHSPRPVCALLEAFGLSRSDIAHWLVHAGGLKVISAVGAANGLDPHALRHASNVLRRSGNLGSTAVLFSYADLIAEGTTAAGDFGLMITMGPGISIETALLSWPRRSAAAAPRPAVRAS